jgi:hypothetical protein
MDERQRTVINATFATGFVQRQWKTNPTRDARALRRILKLTLSAWPASSKPLMAPRGTLRCNEEILLDENGY